VPLSHKTAPQQRFLTGWALVIRSKEVQTWSQVDYLMQPLLAALQYDFQLCDL
jgi:hypothetical protein